MKKAYTAAAGLLALVLCLTAALASGGSDQDPLISLSYLEGAFSQSVDAAVDSRLDEWDRQAAASMERQLDAMGSGQVDGTASEADLKEGDVLAGSTGLAVTPLAGEVRLEIASGAVVDATEGREVPGGTVLDANHLYIVAESSSASFVVDSPTAVLSYQGGGALSLSYGAPDYYAIARALRQLGLFRGTGSGIGEGFDLHQSPTRGGGPGHVHPYFGRGGPGHGLDGRTPLHRCARLAGPLCGVGLGAGIHQRRQRDDLRRR